MARRSRGKTSGSATSSHSDLTQEDLADEIEPVSDEWAADYEYDLDRRDTMAAGGYSLADAEPELFGQYIHHFAWPRISGRKSDLTIAERKGHHRGWISRVVAHRGHVRYRVERHLDPARYWHRTAWTRPGIRPNLAYWLALPHGNTTRNVTIDIDNHGPILATFRRGFASIHPIWPGTDVCPPDPAILTLPDLSVDALEKARRLHITLGSEARWCLSSRSLGFHVIRVLDRARDSHAAAVCMRRAVSKAGLPAGTEVYPWGGHAHRLPFGLDFHSFSPDGELVGGFEDQMRLYLDGRPAPFWDDLLNCLLRHWRSLIEEASWHICGVKTWRNLRGRIESTTKDIDRWRSGSSVVVLAGGGRDRVAPPRTLAAMKVADVPDWTTYVEDFKAKPHYWLAMVQDLAVNGLPCHDSIDRAARELGRFLIHVQGLGIDEAADLVWRWAEGKSNGFITRFQSGKSGEVRGQIRRVVGHVAREADFGGRLARMRDKLLAGRYRNPIDLMSLMACPVDRVVRDLPDQAKIEEEVILVDKNVSNEITESIWAVIQERMMLSQPRDLRRRPGWWQIVRSVVGKLQAHGGEAPLSKAVQATLGGSAPTVKGVIDKLVVAGVIRKGERRYGKPMMYRLVDLPRRLPEEGR